MLRILATSSLTLLPIAAFADVPKVAADIAPVHSLISAVMGDLGEPDLILPPGASPHGYAMRPSEARALANAELVVWIGSELTPWLEGPLDQLAPTATRLTLIDLPETTVLEPRGFDDGHDHGHDDHGDEAHDDHGHDDHGHDDKEHDDHGHDDHDHDHGHDDHAADEHDDHKHEEHGHDEHADADHDDHGSHDHHDHDHGSVDPHAWLSIANADAWLGVIADVLSDMDPSNASTYAANAAAAQADLVVLREELAETLADVESTPYLVGHDAQAYFEIEYGLEPIGAITLFHGDAPTPRQLRALRADVAETGATCLLLEAGETDAYGERLAGDEALSTGVVDQLGSQFPLGPDLFAATLRDIAANYRACLTGSSL